MDDREFKDAVESIRDASDIVDVIGAYVPLKRRAGRFLGLCPFHNEKTPSFNVNPNRQSFHCFGCGAGGDVFSFVMRHENVDFIQAARLLAQRAGLSIELSPGHGANPEATREKDDLYKALQKVARFYQNQLKESPEAEPARAYVKERGLDAAVDVFDIGYSPLRFETLVNWGKQEGASATLLAKAGVLAKGDNGDWYDRFRGRLLFAIRDELNQIVGFSGRLLPGDTRPAKYVNSPETPIFRKSRIMYGLHKAKKPILDRQTALLCEGQIDVIRCHLSGFDHAVAAQGTAITEDHARVLKRCADAVTLVLDGDAAGQKAALRSINTLIGAGIAVNVAVLPEGEDPDSLLIHHGREALQVLLDRAVPAIDFQVETLRPDGTAANDAEVLRTVTAVLETIAQAPTAVYQEQLLRRAADTLGLDEQALRQDLFTRLSRTTTRVRPDSSPPAEKTARPVEEQVLIALMLHQPSCIDLIAQYIGENHLTDPDLRTLFSRLLSHTGDDDWDIMAELVEAPEAVKELAATLLADENKYNDPEVPPALTAQELVLTIRRKRLTEQLKDLKALRSTASGERYQELDIEVKTIIHDIRALKSGWDHARDLLELHDTDTHFFPQ